MDDVIATVVTYRNVKHLWIGKYLMIWPRIWRCILKTPTKKC